MKYGVSVCETSFGYITVEADSVEDAKEKAEAEYENGNVYWKNSDSSCTSVRLEQEKTDSYDTR